MQSGWKLAGSFQHLHAWNHGYRSAEGDSRLAELADWDGNYQIADPLAKRATFPNGYCDSWLAELSVRLLSPT